MRIYRIVVSAKAKSDIDGLFDFIVTEYKSIVTANQYIDGLENTIRSLSRSAEVYRLQTGRYFKQFGNNARRINFKKMAIIYSIYSNIVYIQRVVPSALIID